MIGAVGRNGGLRATRADVDLGRVGLPNRPFCGDSGSEVKSMTCVPGGGLVDLVMAVLLDSGITIGFRQLQQNFASWILDLPH